MCSCSISFCLCILTSIFIFTFNNPPIISIFFYDIVYYFCQHLYITFVTSIMNSCLAPLAQNMDELLVKARFFSVTFNSYIFWFVQFVLLYISLSSSGSFCSVVFYHTRVLVNINVVHKFNFLFVSRIVMFHHSSSEGIYFSCWLTYL